MYVSLERKIYIIYSNLTRNKRQFAECHLSNSIDPHFELGADITLCMVGGTSEDQMTGHILSNYRLPPGLEYSMSVSICNVNALL